MVRSKLYIMNGYMEMEVFNIPPDKAMKRQRRITETRPAQRKLNDKNSRKYFARLVNSNFVKSDLAVDLTYDNDNLPDTKEEVYRDVKNYISRLKRARAKEGLPPMKYIYVISNCDQYGNETRWHVHMFIDKMDRDVVEQKWGKGYVNAARLQPTETGLTGKAMYVARQKKGERSWGASTNLKKPEAIVSDHKITRRQLEHMATRPDDRQFIERLINNKNYEWTLTDCIIERDGRQIVMDGLMPNSFNNGISLMIRARRNDGRQTDKRSAVTSLLHRQRDQDPAIDAGAFLN